MIPSELIRILKNAAIASLAVAALVLVDRGVAALGIWTYLTVFFKVIRVVISPIAWLWDFDTTFQVFGYVLTFACVVWAFKAYLAARNFFMDTTGN